MSSSALSEPIGFHVTLRLRDDRPIATTPVALRVLARIMLLQGEQRSLLAFGAADDHVHVALATDRWSAGMFARYVQTALGWQLQLRIGFERARIRPLHDQRHAYHTFHYAHRQASHHGVAAIDATHEGTSLPDLLGLRLVSPSLLSRVRTHLPRIRRHDLVAAFPPGALDRSADRPLDLEVLADAAAAALALPDIRRPSTDCARARRAAVHAAGPEVPTSILGDALNIGARAVRALRNAPREPLLIRAIELQCLLRRPPAQPAPQAARLLPPQARSPPDAAGGSRGG